MGYVERWAAPLAELDAVAGGDDRYIGEDLTHTAPSVPRGASGAVDVRPRPWSG